MGPSPKADIWDIETGKALASLITFKDGSWAAVDLSGRYDASDPDYSSSLYWVTDNLRAIGLGQLKRENTLRAWLPGYCAGALGRRDRHGHCCPAAGNFRRGRIQSIQSEANDWP